MAARNQATSARLISSNSRSAGRRSPSAWRTLTKARPICRRPPHAAAIDQWIGALLSVNVATRTGFAGPLSGELLDISRADVALVARRHRA